MEAVVQMEDATLWWQGQRRFSSTLPTLTEVGWWVT
jgi:hypothetical protein